MHCDLDWLILLERLFVRLADCDMLLLSEPLDTLRERHLLRDMLADLLWLGSIDWERLLLCEALRHWQRERDSDALRLRLWLRDFVWDRLELTDRD